VVDETVVDETVVDETVVDETVVVNGLFVQVFVFNFLLTSEPVFRPVR
jgi:hypothetical protein